LVQARTPFRRVGFFRLFSNTYTAVPVLFGAVFSHPPFAALKRAGMFRRNGIRRIVPVSRYLQNVFSGAFDGQGDFPPAASVQAVPVCSAPVMPDRRYSRDRAFRFAARAINSKK
jgi:hypothetical protein